VAAVGVQERRTQVERSPPSPVRRLGRRRDQDAGRARVRRGRHSWRSVVRRGLSHKRRWCKSPPRASGHARRWSRCRRCVSNHADVFRKADGGLAHAPFNVGRQISFAVAGEVDRPLPRSDIQIQPRERNVAKMQIPLPRPHIHFQLQRDVHC